MGVRKKDYANTMQFYFAFRRGQCRKKKGLEINLNPLLSSFVVVGDERFELPTLYMSTEYLVDEALFNKNHIMLILWNLFKVKEGLSIAHLSLL